MKKGVSTLLSMILTAVIISCGGENKNDAGNTGNTLIDVDDDTGNAGDDDSTVDTGAPCADSDKFCHFHDRLYWSDKAEYSMYWADAVTYCENFGGRLPTISELRTLVQNCPAGETGFECRVTDYCLYYNDCWSDTCKGCEVDESGKYSVFGDTGWFWSSSGLSDYANLAWLVNFNFGGVYDSFKNFKFNVRCVHD